MASRKKYCQNNEDRIIDRLLVLIGKDNEKGGFCVDIGAGNGYALSNIRHLIETGKWRHCMIDGNARGCPEVHEHWITAENITELLKQYQVPVDAEVFSLDLDGNDYWIWKSILAGGYRPLIICTEINTHFGPETAATIKYAANHHWTEDSYYGASWRAFQNLFKQYQYTFVKAVPGLNGFWVRTDHITDGIRNYQDKNPPAKYPVHKPSSRRDWVINPPVQ